MPRFSTMLLTLTLLAACQEEPRAQQQAKTEIFVTGGVLQFDGKNSPAISTPVKSSSPILLPQENDPSLDISDPCSANLQALTGQLLFYYSLGRMLPESLDKLPPLPGESKAALVCPKTGKPYAYFPQGLRSGLLASDRKTGRTTEGNLLILVDSEPAHVMTQRLSDGKKEWTEKQTVRLGIVMEPPAPNSKAVKMYVVPIQQALFDLYIRSRP